MNSSALLNNILQDIKKLDHNDKILLHDCLQSLLHRTTRQPCDEKQFRTLTSNPEYYNPYECGPRQSQLPTTVRELGHGGYWNDPEMLRQIGIVNSQHGIFGTPDHIRNVDIESGLGQRQMTRIPGQRRVTENQMDRFQFLPFNPQNPDHLVWRDGTPRGGISTRTSSVRE